MRILKIRRLPLKGSVIVKQGADVTAETVVARTELPGNVQPIKAASLLGVHQQDLREFMLKKEGDSVAKDEVIATSKSFFGLFKSHCRCPVQGRVESISDVTGQVIIVCRFRWRTRISTAGFRRCCLEGHRRGGGSLALGSSVGGDDRAQLAEIPG
jgi:hypothetical protein